MKHSIMSVMLLILGVSVAVAQVEQIPVKGNGFDGGAVFVSSMSVRQSGSSTFSTTKALIDSSAFNSSKNTDWLLDNSEGEYDIMIDSCIWRDKGTKLLLGVDMPFILPKGGSVSIDGKCQELIHGRILSELKGYTTLYFIKTYKK